MSSVSPKFPLSPRVFPVLPRPPSTVPVRPLAASVCYCSQRPTPRILCLGCSVFCLPRKRAESAWEFTTCHPRPLAGVSECQPGSLTKEQTLSVVFTVKLPCRARPTPPFFLRCFFCVSFYNKHAYINPYQLCFRKTQSKSTFWNFTLSI